MQNFGQLQNLLVLFIVKLTLFTWKTEFFNLVNFSDPTPKDSAFLLFNFKQKVHPLPLQAKHSPTAVISLGVFPRFHVFPIFLPLSILFYAYLFSHLFKFYSPLVPAVVDFILPRFREILSQNFQNYSHFLFRIVEKL